MNETLLLILVVVTVIETRFQLFARVDLNSRQNPGFPAAEPDTRCPSGQVFAKIEVRSQNGPL